MSAIRLTALIVTLVGLSALFAPTDSWAQKTYTISRATSGNSQYLQLVQNQVGRPLGSFRRC
jgi:hypothetical protein